MDNIEATFAHAYGTYVCMLKAWELAASPPAECDKEQEELLIDHAVYLQTEAVEEYRSCSEQEKEKRFQLEREERIRFESMIAYPAELKDETDQLNSKVLALKKQKSTLRKQVRKLRTDNKRKKSRIKAIRTSTSYRIGCGVTWLPRNVKRAAAGVQAKASKMLKRTVKAAVSFQPGEVYRKQKKYRHAPKRIAILAFEGFHYNVTENTMRICNVERNYIIAYLRQEAADEIKAALGDLAGSIEWHTYSQPDLPDLTDQDAGMPVEELIRLFVEDVQKKKRLDYIILPSPEYHPEWYLSLVENRNRPYKLVAGVHNLNTVFFSGCATEHQRTLFDLADYYGVIDSSLKKTLLEKGWPQEKIMLFPTAFSPLPTEKRTLPGNDGRVTFVVTGGVEAKRKDYQSLVDALERIPEQHPRIRIILLGKADGLYAQKIIAQLDKMKETGLESLTYSDRVPIEEFGRVMHSADWLLGPVVVKTDFLGVPEYYGETKGTGIIGDIIQYALPAVITGSMKIPDELRESIIQYGSTEELSELFGKLLDRKVIEEYREKARQNSEKFALSELLWDQAQE